MKDTTPPITRGQASCLALSMLPTEENRKAAKELLNASLFDVVYLQNYNPLTPVAIGKATKCMNPYLYCSYPDTPPPEMEELEEPGVVNDRKRLSEDIDQSTPNLRSKKAKPASPVSTENTASVVSSRKSSPGVDDKGRAVRDHSRKLILKFLRRVLLNEDPKNNARYEFKFVTPIMQYEIMKDSITEPIGDLNQSLLASWVSRQDHFGPYTSVDGEKGRWHYVLKKKFRDMEAVSLAMP